MKSNAEDAYNLVMSIIAELREHNPELTDSELIASLRVEIKFMFDTIAVIALTSAKTSDTMPSFNFLINTDNDTRDEAFDYAKAISDFITIHKELNNQEETT